jgi:hypothetical protein
MAKPISTTPSFPSDMEPVINRHDRMYQLVHVTDREPLARDSSGSPVMRIRDSQITRIAPGLNFIPASVLLEAGFDPKNFRNAVTIQSPAQLPDDLAIALAERTLSRQALRMWADVENRPEVLEAITARLAQKGSRALRE